MMVRIVCSQTGSSRARVRVTAQHITVRHKPSDAFLAQIQRQRVTGEEVEKIPENRGFSLKDRAASEPPPAENRAEWKEQNPPVQLPRLAAFLDRSADQETQSERVEKEQAYDSAAELPSDLRMKMRPRRPTRLSAYEELRERLERE